MYCEMEHTLAMGISYLAGDFICLGFRLLGSSFFAKYLPALLAVVLWEEAVCDKHSPSHEDENTPGGPNQDINHAL